MDSQTPIWKKERGRSEGGEGFTMMTIGHGSGKEKGVTCLQSKGDNESV